MAKKADTPADLTQALKFALELPGEAALVELLRLLGKFADYELELLRYDPELATAGRRRLEAIMDAVVKAVGIEVPPAPSES